MDSYSEYKVVINDEDQYSIYRFSEKNALGWWDEGQIGTSKDWTRAN